MEYKLTTGNISRSLVVFSLPMILGNLLQQLYNVADTLIVGKTVGPAALSAVGSSYALMVLLTSVILGLCMGSGVVFARLYGAGRTDDMKTSIFNAFVFILLVGAAVNIASYLLLDQFIQWIHVPAQAVAYTRTYLRIIFAGMTFVSLYNFFASVLRSAGNTVVPLVFLAVAAVTNIILDLIFILAFHLGVAGAALATIAAQALSAGCISGYTFVKAKHLCPSKRHMRFDKRLLKLIAGNSVLTSIQQSIMNFGILMVQGLVNSFGFAASAAFAAVVKIDAFAYMPAQDFGNAFSTFIAQNHGAKQPERIHKGTVSAIKISSAFCVFASVCVCVFAEPLMQMFVKKGEAEIIGIGIEYLRIEGLFYIGIGVLFLLYGLFRGFGKSGISIVLTVISLGSRVLLAYTLSAVPAVGMVGIWWSVPIGWALADLAGILIYFRYKKRLIPNPR
ncbi:MAG: MATE family efflux transporter [Christensenellales bacterium]